MQDRSRPRDTGPGTTAAPGRPARPAPVAGIARRVAQQGAAGMTPGQLQALQRTAGNAALAGVLGQEQHVHGAGCGHEAVQRSAVHEVLRSPGRPLDTGVRSEMESRLGADFSDVRVHSDNAGHTAAESVAAHAFTSGSHIAFQRGRYNPGSASGKHILAHELTHVIQQRSGPVAGTDAGDGLKVSDPADRFEREAESNATRAMSGRAPDQRS